MSGDAPPPTLEGRVVLVTGGTGFLGSWLVRRLLAYDVAEIRVLTRNANAPQWPFESRGRQPQLILGDVSDERVLGEAVRGAQVIFHLAALKSVEMCEKNPTEAIKANVHATGMLIQAALAEPRIERFIAVSSDKACTPTSVYGMTKALMERIVAQADGLSGADFGSVRCGSLWGSTGSVVARWEDAARSGSDLLVTDPEMTRFVMLRREAIDLIVEAASREMGGSILCRVMPAYVLGDLAAVMSEVHRLKQRVIGRGTGEKLHEDLVSGGEAPFAERHGDFVSVTLGRRSAGAGPYDSGNARHLTRPELRTLLGSSVAATG
jgi:UDP-N-acetylglucosamine 4,6-dehydratase